MKKLLSLFLVSIIVVAMATSCSDVDVEISDTASQTVESSSSSSEGKWYGTSTPSDYISQTVESSLDASFDVSDESSVESSEDSESSEWEDLSDSIIGSDDIEGLVTDFPARAATSYRIAFTKESALNATECISNVSMSIPITAIYDGSVTRFFHAVKGTFYHAVPGKYLYPCCDGFLSGDLNKFNANYAVMFEFDDEGNASVKTEHSGHGAIGTVYDFYSEKDGCAFAWFADLDNKLLLSYIEDNLVICREYLSDQSVSEATENGEFSLDDSLLGKYGLVKNDEVIIPFEYDSMVTVYGGNTVGVVMAQKDDRTYYFSTNGTNLTPDGYDCGAQPYNNRAWVFEDGQGYILEFK